MLIVSNVVYYLYMQTMWLFFTRKTHKFFTRKTHKFKLLKQALNNMNYIQKP